ISRLGGCPSIVCGSSRGGIVALMGVLSAHGVFEQGTKSKTQYASDKSPHGPSQDAANPFNCTHSFQLIKVTGRQLLPPGCKNTISGGSTQPSAYSFSKPILACVPSQNGFLPLAPQRQRCALSIISSRPSV